MQAVLDDDSLLSHSLPIPIKLRKKKTFPNTISLVSYSMHPLSLSLFPHAPFVSLMCERDDTLVHLVSLLSWYLVRQYDTDISSPSLSLSLFRGIDKRTNDNCIHTTSSEKGTAQ
jgi:hypothetical protein